jgi:hypothetical protein
VDLHLLAFGDEQRHTDLEAGLERGQLGDAAARGIAAHTGLGRGDGQLDMRWKLQPDRTTVISLNLYRDVVHQQLTIVADHRGVEGNRVECLLVHEVMRVVVAVKIGGGDGVEIGLPELLAGLEALVEDGAGEQIPHLDSDQRLAAPGCRFRNLDVQTVVRGILELEVHLALDLDRLNHRRHSATVTRLGDRMIG